MINNSSFLLSPYTMPNVMLHVLYRLSPLNLTIALKYKDNYPYFMGKERVAKNKVGWPKSK